MRNPGRWTSNEGVVVCGVLQSLRSTDVIHQEICSSHMEYQSLLWIHIILVAIPSHKGYIDRISLLLKCLSMGEHTPAPSSFLPPACVSHLPVCFCHRPVFLSACAFNLPVFITTAYIGLLCFSLDLSAFLACVSESRVYFCH